MRGDTIEVYPTYDDNAYRIELWGDEVESLAQIDPLLGQVKQTYTRLPIYPKTHYVMSEESKLSAMDSIRAELEWWHKELEKQGKPIEAQRLYQRTMFDLEMIKEIGLTATGSRTIRAISRAACRERHRRRCWIIFRTMH